MANEAAVWQARTLVRAAKAGTLCTTADGQPFAALVTPAAAPDLSVLMLLSSLSEHTRHLRADPRCALLLAGAPDGPNPQTAPRVNLMGQATPEPDLALKARWVARHPYAAFYAGFTDFTLFRLRPTAAQFVGGFASAHRLTQAELTPDPAAVAAIGAAEAGIVAHMNEDHGAAMDRITGEGTGWRMGAVDVDGCDLVRGEDVRRVAWAAAVADAGGVRAELVRMARQA